MDKERFITPYDETVSGHTWPRMSSTLIRIMAGAHACVQNPWISDSWNVFYQPAVYNSFPSISLYHYQEIRQKPVSGNNYRRIQTAHKSYSDCKNYIKEGLGHAFSQLGDALRYPRHHPLGPGSRICKKSFYNTLYLLESKNVDGECVSSADQWTT